MLLDNMYVINDTELLEQQYGGMPGERPDDPNADPAFPEGTPLKKFELLQKMTFMRNALREQNIYDDDLDLVIRFGAELSYETLLMLTNALVDRLKEHLTEISNNIKQQQKQEQESKNEK